MNKEYKNIEGCTDKQYLYDNLSDNALQIIDNVIEAYYSNRIDFVEPRFEDGEPDFCGEFELTIKDNSYEKNGNELLILKWVEDYEDTEYMVECLQEIK